MIADNPFIPHHDKFTNTSEFTYLARFFTENKLYCNIPEGTLQHLEFWKDVKEKCINGMTNSVGQSITGPHFFYLNFCPILGQNEKTGRKTKIFPKFVDIDYEYFWMVDYCRGNGKNLIAVKGRRQGWSYKGSGLLSHEFTFYPESKNIIGAFYGAYSQNTMDMCLDNLNHIATSTPFGHIRNPNLRDYVMSKYEKNISGVKVWAGFQSTIESYSFKDRPGAVVGKSANWLLLDEAGLFPNIVDAWGYTEPLIKDGSTYTGNAVIYGSSGDMDTGSKYFYEMFTNPGKYNMLEFDDPEGGQSKIGFFSSALKGRWGKCMNPKSPWYKQVMVDEDGNSNLQAALDDLEFDRINAKNGSDPKALQAKITQFPTTWKEAFLRNKANVFGSVEMLEWLGQLENTPSLRNQAQVGELYYSGDNILRWKPNDELHQILNFPLKANLEDSTGAITIWEHPDQEEGQVPNWLYIAGNDPYDHDESGTGSLGSFMIYKRFYQASKTNDILVAEYTGRPEKADMFYENCRKLCIYYNAKCLYENQLKGFKTYFEIKNSLHYLFESPGVIKDIVKDSRVQRGYGIHMNKGIKDQCEIYLKQWLYEEKTDLEGKKLLNLHTIKSIPLLKELLAYDREINTDRVVAFMLCILQTKELHRIHVEELSNTNDTSMKFLKDFYNKNTIFNKGKLSSAFR